jgi:N-acetylglutamate synthase-like GNAT family acetyltransferase
MAPRHDPQSTPKDAGRSTSTLARRADRTAADLGVRVARPSDLPALERFLARCSPDTLYRRFHGVAGALAQEEVRRTAHPSATHRAVVAVVDGEVHGIGTLAFGRDGEAEIAFVVEDAWMRRGVGRVLARGVLREARRLRVPRLVAYVQPDNGRARDFFRSIAPGASVRLEDRELIVDIPVTLAPVDLDLAAAAPAPVAPTGDRARPAAVAAVRPVLAAG